MSDRFKSIVEEAVFFSIETVKSIKDIITDGIENMGFNITRDMIDEGFDTGLTADSTAVTADDTTHTADET